MRNKKLIIAIWVAFAVLGLAWFWIDWLVDFKDGIGLPVGMTFLALYLGCSAVTISNLE
jgi:hypothetical protein